MHDPGVPRADEKNLPSAVAAGADARLVDVWCSFLGSLATDAQAALAAALAYRELDGAARTVWIAAIEQDLAGLDVPRIAVYAPLLAVETDPARRERIARAVGAVPPEVAPRATARALTARGEGGARLSVIVTPLYLDFVQVIACAHRLDAGFDWVKHDPIVEEANAPRVGDRLSGFVLEAAPFDAVVDDLAQTIVAEGRSGRRPPEALSVFADLFGLGPPRGAAHPPVR